MLTRSRSALYLALSCVMFSCFSGCQLFMLPILLFDDRKDPAACPALEERRVAIVCKTSDSLLYSDPEVTADLSRKIAQLLRDNGKKITVVPHAEVANWIDEQQDNWRDFKEVGEGVGADTVVGIDLSKFSLYRGQTLYQGRADARMTVYDLEDEGKLIYEPDLPQIVFPTTPVDSGVSSKRAFRRRFIGNVAEKLAKHFYDHDHTSDFATDSTVLR
jgi:hypothetical protein